MPLKRPFNRKRCAGNAGNGFEFIEQIPIEQRNGGVFIAGGQRADAEKNEPGGGEAQFHLAKALQAMHEQTCSDEKDERDCDLRDDQNFGCRKTAMAASVVVPETPDFQNGRKIDARGAQRGN